VERYLGAAFLAFWLCMWAFGRVDLSAALVAGWLNGGLQGIDYFLAGLFVFWAVGGILVARGLWDLLRPTRPESVRLGVDTFRHDPERAPLGPSRKSSAFGRSKPMEVNRVELAGFALDRDGERQRLSFDRGGERVEIGPCLREPEREWLHQVLETWRQG
jgi:hypothetical protein